MSVPRADFAAVALPSGKVLLVGGQTSVTADTATADLFDPATGTITPAAPMSAPRAGNVALLLPNGKVLVAGGTSVAGGPAIASAELYDPGANTWSPAASMAQARAHSAALVMPNGKVFVAGGDGGNGQPIPNSNEVYDPETNTWTGVSAQYGTRPFGPAVATLRDGRVIIYGGQSRVEPGNQYEFYDPKTSQESYGGMIPDTYNFTTPAVVAGGSVMFVGGQASYNPAGPLATTYVYNPFPESFDLGPSMNVGHCRHTLSILPQGRLLVAGGGTCGGAQPIGVAEVFEPVGKRWWPAGTMNVARGFHAAASLPDGRVLVAGGFVAGGGATATMEIYSPV